MHKVLYDAGLWLDDAIDNERLTDVACVYAGLGKIMLNGCWSRGYSRQGLETDFSVWQIQEEELAFDYAVICEMRGIVQDQADAYLADQPVGMVRYWRARFAPLTKSLSGDAAFRMASLKLSNRRRLNFAIHHETSGR